MKDSPGDAVKTHYRGNREAILALVRPDSIHRDLYLDPELFDLEMEQLWRNTWVYVGHDSQVPGPGDFYSTVIGREPVMMIRGTDGEVRILPNRCAHKGTKLVSAVHGKCPGGTIRCPYHGWTYKLDGALRTIPLKSGYDGTDFQRSEAAAGLRQIASVNYRGFVFARLSAQGPDFHSFFGESLT